jgi:hypothetical protein
MVGKDERLGFHLEDWRFIRVPVYWPKLDAVIRAESFRRCVQEKLGWTWR